MHYVCACVENRACFNGMACSPTCTAVELVLDGVFYLQLDVLWHVFAVRNVPAQNTVYAGRHSRRKSCARLCE